jgi:membrane protease YdiL (CAAX protease family)
MVQLSGIYIFPIALVPGLIALIFMFLRKEKFSQIGWRVSGITNWFIAMFYPLILCGLTIGIGYVGKVLVFTGVANHETIALATLVDFPLLLVWTLPMTLGMELGWRGYLLRSFTQRSVLTGAIVGSSAWAISQSVTIYYLASNSAQSVLLGAILFLNLFFLGLILSWLYIRSKSVLIVSLMQYGTVIWNVLLFSSPFSMMNEIVLGDNHTEYEGIFKINLGGIEHGEWRLTAMVNFVLGVMVVIWLIRNSKPARG